MMKYYRVVGTKKFAVWSLVVLAPVVGWFMTDHNFFLIITWPDNIPISILIVTITWLTWYALYRCAENDKRIEAGECPIEATPENINEDAFGAWLIKLEVSDTAPLENLMDHKSYLEYCEANS